jgi:hypothetical protein
MRFSRVTRTALLAVGIAVPGGCGDQGGSLPGVIEVVVEDHMVPPAAMPPFEIVLTPLGDVSQTDSTGRARFVVPAGTYVVNAELCCVGPGFIEYHEPASVGAGETVEVRLRSCLACQ